MKTVWSMMIAVPLLMAAASGSAPASEEGFLKSLAGDWTGKGTVKTRLDSAPLDVTCNFDSQASDQTLSMKGTCRGLILISRSIGADLKVSGSRYSGIYIGPAGGRSGLNGNRSGNTINLAVHWAKTVNGDRNADMTIQKLGSNGMKLTTIDINPASGQRVTTSEIHLL